MHSASGLGQITGSTPEASFTQAQAALARGDASAAESLLRELVQQYPSHADSWFLLGNLLYRHRRWNEAEACYRQVLSLQSTAPPAHLNLGSVLREQQRYEEAVVHYEEAIRCQPTYAEAYANLANVFMMMGKWEQAEQHYRKALDLKPNHAETLYNLGNFYREQQRYDDAIAYLKQALTIRPDFAEAYNTLGTIYYQLEQAEKSEQYYRQALVLQPRFVDAAYNLGLALQLQGKAHEAEDCYRQLLKHTHDWGAALRLAVMVNPIAADTVSIHTRRQEMQEALRALASQPIQLTDPVRECAQTNFYLAYQGLNNKPIQSELAQLLLKACPSLGWEAPHIAGWKKPAGRKIRLGFISAFFRKHTMGKFTRGLIEHMPKDIFDVLVFRLPGPHDSVAEEINEAADKVIVLPRQLGTARQLIAQEAPDILFYPDIGIDAFTYFLAYARLAPVQCVSWGHPDTTGIPHVDYFLSSRLLETSEAQAHYSEKLILLATLPAYYYRPEVVPAVRSRQSFHLPAEGRLYVCPQSLFKFHPDFDSLLAEILRRDHQAILVLIEGIYPHWKQMLVERFRRFIPDVADRIHFLPQMPQADFLGLLKLADAVLDTPFFGGGTSSYEAIANDVPIVTMPGEFMRSRVTAGCYQRMGIDSLIASSPEDYVTLALRLAQDTSWKREQVALLHAHADVLFEDALAIEEITRFFVQTVTDDR